MAQNITQKSKTYHIKTEFSPPERKKKNYFLRYI